MNDLRQHYAAIATVSQTFAKSYASSARHDREMYLITRKRIHLRRFRDNMNKASESASRARRYLIAAMAENE